MTEGCQEIEDDSICYCAYLSHFMVDVWLSNKIKGKCMYFHIRILLSLISIKITIYSIIIRIFPHLVFY